MRARTSWPERWSASLPLPLSMALAIAVGAPPQHGLYTAIVAGAVVALLGGSEVCPPAWCTTPTEAGQAPGPQARRRGSVARDARDPFALVSGNRGRQGAQGRISPDGLSLLEALADSCRLMVGFVIPLLPRLSRRMPPSGPLRSAGGTPRQRSSGPIRQALAFTALRVSARAVTLLPRVFSAGRAALPVFTHDPSG